MSIRTLTQEDPIGLAGGLNLYGFAGGDPINFWDPFGLCEDENGNARPCRVTWRDGADENVTDETKAAAQELADHADVDLELSSGRRGDATSCAGVSSRHNCGKAFDVAAINGGNGWVDVGQGQDVNADAIGLISQVQGAAYGMNQVRENFGPLGLWKAQAAGMAPNRIGFSSGSYVGLSLTHMNHIHISIQ